MSPDRAPGPRWLPLLMLAMLAVLAGGAMWATGQFVGLVGQAAGQVDPQAIARTTLRTALNMGFGYQSIERAGETPDPPFDIAVSTESGLVRVEGRTGLPDGCQVEVEVLDASATLIRSAPAMASGGRFTAVFAMDGMPSGSYDVLANFEIIDEATVPKEVFDRWPDGEFHGPAVWISRHTGAPMLVAITSFRTTADGQP